MFCVPMLVPLEKESIPAASEGVLARRLFSRSPWPAAVLAAVAVDLVV